MRTVFTCGCLLVFLLTSFRVCIPNTPAANFCSDSSVLAFSSARCTSRSVFLASNSLRSFLARCIAANLVAAMSFSASTTGESSTSAGALSTLAGIAVSAALTSLPPAPVAEPAAPAVTAEVPGTCVGTCANSAAPFTLDGNDADALCDASSTGDFNDSAAVGGTSPAGVDVSDAASATSPKGNDGTGILGAGASVALLPFSSGGSCEISRDSGAVLCVTAASDPAPPPAVGSGQPFTSSLQAAGVSSGESHTFR